MCLAKIVYNMLDALGLWAILIKLQFGICHHMSWVSKINIYVL